MFSQDNSIRASAPSVVTQGQAFNYTIEGDFDGKVELPAFKGMRLAGGPSTMMSQQTQYVNGRMQTSKTLTYTYTLVATDEGDYVIPPATVSSGRQEFKTNEVSIKIVKSGSTPNVSGSQDNTVSEADTKETVFIRQIPSRTSVYQGEQIIISTKIYTQEALNISDFKAPEFNGFWRQELDPDTNPVRETVNGETYLSQVFKRDLLTAQKTGQIKIDPADITCMIRKKVSRGRPSAFDDPFFGDAFFDRYESVPQDFKTNSPLINVKPLPPGAPDGFSGAVGNFSMKVNVDKDKLKVNDAITLKVTISGTGNLDLLKPVKIDFPPDLEVFDPKSTQNLKHSTNGTSGTVSYEYVVIPRHAGNFRIAPINFSWFDPAEGKYKTSKSSEFNFSVDKSDGNDEAYISSPAGTGSSNSGGNEVVSLAGDIQFIRLTPALLVPAGKTLFGTTLFYLMYLIPLFILITLVILRRERIKRNADFNAVRNRQARKLAKKRLKTAAILLKSDDKGFYDEILKAVWGYLADKLGVNVSELSRDRISTELQKIRLDQDILDSLFKLLDTCELARYASGFEGNKQEVYSDAISLISVLQEKIS
ncbi:MAG: protein BatD [Spirochaetales bacterium]|nr:protein BatD [Spirochaetales bacterium]